MYYWELLSYGLMVSSSPPMLVRGLMENCQRVKGCDVGGFAVSSSLWLGKLVVRVHCGPGEVRV